MFLQKRKGIGALNKPLLPFNWSKAIGSAANMIDFPKPVGSDTNVSFPLRIEFIALICSGFN